MKGRCAIAAREYVKVEDQVRDLMLLTLPSLKADIEDISVEPDLLMQDDGMDSVFFEAFLRDEVSEMETRLEAHDLETEAETIPETDAVFAIAPAEAAPALSAPIAPLAISAAEACEALTAPVTMALPMPEDVLAIAEPLPEEEPVAEVPQAPKVWRVCFSF